MVLFTKQAAAAENDAAFRGLDRNARIEYAASKMTSITGGNVSRFGKSRPSLRTGSVQAVLMKYLTETCEVPAQQQHPMAKSSRLARVILSRPAHTSLFLEVEMLYPPKRIALGAYSWVRTAIDKSFGWAWGDRVELLMRLPVDHVQRAHPAGR